MSLVINNFPSKKYKVIYADPPWHFQNWNNDKAQTNPIHHYPTMSMKELEKLPVGNIADDNCILFMWCTDPLLDKQIPLVEKWGFKYKTVAFYWIKTNKDKIKNYYFKGPGLWTRANPEICILATKGKPKRLSGNVDRLVVSDRREHSRKPDIVRKHITDLVGDISRIELFARQEFDGWDHWGNEL